MLKFTIQKKLEGTLARAGVIETTNGQIKTPAFVTVGTKATVKALTAEQIRGLGGAGGIGKYLSFIFAARRGDCGAGWRLWSIYGLAWSDHD